MKIKRTFAPTMREALTLVKQEQGADAVILGNKKVPGGVEILSAVDFDHQQSDAYQGEPQHSVSTSQPATAQSNNQETTTPKLAAVGDNEPLPMDVPDFLLPADNQQRKEPVLGLVSETPRARASTPGQAANISKPSLDIDLTSNQSIASVTNSASSRKQAAAKNTQRAHTRKSNRGLPVEEEALRRSQLKQVQGDNRTPVNPAPRKMTEERSELMQQLRSTGFEGIEREQTVNHSSHAETGEHTVIDEVKGELKNLRDLMQSQLSVLDWDRYSELHPVKTVLLNLLNEMGLGSDVIEMVFSQLGELRDQPQKLWQQCLGLLARSIPILESNLLQTGGRIALVGSTGVGKTTTIAKLAARFAHSNGKHSVALITTDNFRIGAQEQLQHFARMLEIPLLTANSSDELADRLNMLADKRLVLIDTAGMSQSDVRLSEQFHQLQHGAPEITPYLVLSANMQLAAMNETLKNFAKVKLGGGIVTKLDESTSLGGVITTSIRHQLPLSFCTMGQRVPEDIQLAKNHRLVSKAVSFMQQYGERVDRETLALRYHHIINKR